MARQQCRVTVTTGGSVLQIIRRSEWLRNSYRNLVQQVRRRWHGLQKVHSTTIIEPGCRLWPDLRTGAFCYLGPGCEIGPKVELGHYTMLGPGVRVVGKEHRYRVAGTPTIFAGRPELPSTVIEADVWVGAGAILMAGIRVGRGAIIAAGSVVHKSVPAYEICGGNPAQKIGERFSENQERQLHDQFLNLPPRAGRYAQPLLETPG